MINQASFTLRNRNPDILTCIANLSNDEVFTPPEFANRMLDTLAEAWAADNGGGNIWADSSVKFLDPFTKTGVFLREITRRFVQGLEKEIPELGKRVDHILTKQVYGIAITQITSLLARRSLYCTKHANGEHSIAGGFDDEAGNVWFERLEHTWEGNKCRFCGAPKAIFDRENGLETHAYAFIHTDDIKTRVAELFGEDTMQFDVIIGNPPYQMKGGAGGSSDSSIYHLFVEQAKKLEPKYLSMVIPSRWLAGGRGLDEFRKDMLSSQNLKALVDYPVSKEVFPNVEVKGGICYFLWSDAYSGECDVTVVRGDETTSSSRQLDEFDVFVRDPRAVGILRKVLKAGEKSITEILTADTPFGIATNFDAFRQKKESGDIALHYVQRGKRDVGFVPRDLIKKTPTSSTSGKFLPPRQALTVDRKFPTPCSENHG